MVGLSVQKKLAALLVFAMAIFGNFQITYAKDYQPIAIPIPASLKDYKPIPIPIPKTRGNSPSFGSVGGELRGDKDKVRRYEKFNLNPQPGYDVTLLMNFTIHFAWSDKYSGNDAKKKFVIKDKNGKKIFEEIIKAKLKPSEKYSWSVGDNPKTYDFQVLDEQTENELLKNLSEIDSENHSPEGCAIKKSAYLQMLSDEYPENFDFYWLIAQWLSEISPPSDSGLTKKKTELLQRCALHLDDEMR